ncbi:MAG: pyruvate ferredoxin oxidoreductase gamma subunit [Thermotogaceae bacterium]|jgi:pyruvate ferredoxin oxidoreductase gamma subunit|nr:pyruvate ferredoxin oxidoreductase gamma subunit [Thermotogaceae bacterium]MDN5337571.1 pyruvate ferredoxin oxidoreductase gamma subunit [Thermotogaceae bacterium]
MVETKKDFFEIRWHGRGGQGAKSAAQVVAEVALDSGKYSQAFPEYGAERSGAPMKAFNRISDSSITIHSSVESPDIVVVIDETLLGLPDITAGLDENTGILLVNTNKGLDFVAKKTGFKGKICVVPATTIALEEIKRGIPNTVMLGALAKLTDYLPLESIIENFKKAFAKKLAPEVLEGNIRAIRRGYEEVTCNG